MRSSPAEKFTSSREALQVVAIVAAGSGVLLITNEEFARLEAKQEIVNEAQSGAQIGSELKDRACNG
jgi:hypothetical protein